MPAQRPDLAMSVDPSDPPPSDSGESLGTTPDLAAEIVKHVVAALQSRESPSTSKSKLTRANRGRQQV